MISHALTTSRELPGAAFGTPDPERVMRHSYAPFRSTLEDAKAQAAVKPADLREAAEQLVSSAFIAPMLGAMRESSMAAGPFSPGAVEKRFGPLFDQQVADRVTQASRFTLVDAIVERYAAMAAWKETR